MAITIRKIAEAAGVSRGTVDKVLNNRYGVSPEVRERVKKVAEDLGYKPNLAGKALAHQKKRIRIAIIIVDKQHNQVFQDVYKGAKQAYTEVKDLGLAADFYLMDTDNVDEQLKYIHAVSESDVSALIITPLDHETIIEELKKLAKKNIKIVTINTDIIGIEKVCFIGPESKQSGRVAGHLIGELFPDGADIAIVSGEKKYKVLEERIDGFLEIIGEEYTNIRVASITRNLQNDEEAFIKTNEVLEKNKNIKALYIISSKPMAGIGRALRAHDSKGLKIVCYDVTPEVWQLIHERFIDFAITQEPYMQGYLPVKILFEYFFQNRLPQSTNIYTKLEIKTKENIN